MRKSAINTDDFVVYLQEAEIDFGEDDDPLSYREALQSEKAQEWGEAMEAEMKSMSGNNVWELVEPAGKHKAIGCKWVFKTIKTCSWNS